MGNQGNSLSLEIVLQLLTLAFNAGIIVALVLTHGKDIRSLKHSRERHDREIGVIYGHAGIAREVRG